MSSEIQIQRGGKDDQPRAVPTSPRYAAALVAAMLACSAPMPVLAQGVSSWLSMSMPLRMVIARAM